ALYRISYTVQYTAPRSPGTQIAALTRRPAAVRGAGRENERSVESAHETAGRRRPGAADRGAARVLRRAPQHSVAVRAGAAVGLRRQVLGRRAGAAPPAPR